MSDGGRNSDCGGGDFVEGEVLCGASGFCAPLVEETAIAEGHEVGVREAEEISSAVNPFGGAFELGEEADGRFVDDAMTGGVGVFGAPLLVGEGRLVTDGGKDGGDGFAVLDLGFRFDAVLVALGWGIAIGRERLVGDDPAVAVAADTEDGLTAAEGAVWRVEEEVVLERAGRDLMEACGGELRFEAREVVDAELYFGFDRCHGVIICGCGPRGMWRGGRSG